jgi:2-amino-4-hydroxy-6-hydroxymethyldihydropteridine diphosphokinase
MLSCGDTVSDLTAAVYLGLGANVGNRLANLRLALARMGTFARVEAVSRLYETEPVGLKEQPLFLNAACRVTTGLEPAALLRFLRRLEAEIGRRPGGPLGGPRPIDLDILFYGERVVEAGDLRIPHPRLAERAFVLAPLCDLAPEMGHPLLGRSMRELLDAVGEAGVKVVAASDWAAGKSPLEAKREATA